MRVTRHFEVGVAKLKVVVVSRDGDFESVNGMAK